MIFLEGKHYTQNKLKKEQQTKENQFQHRLSNKLTNTNIPNLNLYELC